MQRLPREVAVCSVHLCRRFDPDRTFPDHSHTSDPAGKLFFLSPLLILPHLSIQTNLSVGYILLNWITSSLQGGKKSQPWGRTINDRQTHENEEGRVFSCCLLLTFCSGGLQGWVIMMMMLMVLMTWINLWKQEEQEALLVNSVLMVKATTGLQSKVLLTDLSKQAGDLSVSKDATELSMHFFIPLLHCVWLCMHMSLHKNTMKPEPHACSLFGPHDRLWCCLESRRQNRCCSPLCRSLMGLLKKTKPPPKVVSLSNIHRFHYELWFDPFSCCLCCSFIQYKPPQPPQASKVSHTVQQGSHEAIQHNQIKDRLSIPGIKREFLYYFPAEIWMVVFS